MSYKKIFGLACALTLVGAVTYNVVGAQPSACYPIVICPYVAGSGAIGGAGGGGAGGRGGAGGAGGNPAPVLKPLTASAVKLSATSVAQGGSINATVTFVNPNAIGVSVLGMVIAGRQPGATHSGGPYTDFQPAMTATAISANANTSFTATLTIPSTGLTGKWEVYPTYQDADGNWHDSPSSYFTVTTGTGGGGGSGGAPAPAPSPTPAPAPVRGFNVGTQSWFFGSWTGNTIFQPNVDWANAYANGTNIWNPQFLSDLQGYTTFRMMDANNTNWSGITSWSQRRLPTDPGNATAAYMDSNTPPATPGLAIEWQIDLCNRGNVNCWFNIPIKADDDYMTQMATLIKSKIKPGLSIYIELSNEVWNGQFSQFAIANNNGAAQKLPGPNQYYQGIAWEMYRALQMYQIFQNVFGASAMGTKVIRVFSTSGNLDLSRQALASVYKSSQWNPNNQKIDLLASAPYPGGGSDGASSNMLAGFKSDVDKMVSGEPVKNLEDDSKTYGIPMIGCYEAGGGYYNNADKFSQNPQSYDAYQYMLNQLSQHLNGPCNIYTLYGTWSSGGAWGSYDHAGQALTDAHKARAIRDWVSARKLSQKKSHRK